MLPQDQLLSDKQIKKLSIEHPDQVFTSEEGKIAYAGLLFENKEKFEQFLKFSQKNNWLLKLFLFFIPKKKRPKQ